MAKLLLPFFLFLHFLNFAQQAQFNITVQDSTIVIGQPFEVNTTITRPYSSFLNCQDTNSNFYPFNFQALKTFETTIINDSTILDSAIYTLVSYKPFKTQDLTLIAGIINHEDSMSIKSNTITFKLNSYIDSVHSELKPKSYTPFYEYKPKSYIEIIEILGICLVIALVILGFIIAKRLYKQQKIKQLQIAFDSLGSNHQSENELYDYLRKWKSFIEKTSGQKIGSLTTSELKEIIKDEHIIKTLSEIDNFKYNPKKSYSTVNTTPLTDYANQCLMTKIKELDEKS